MIFNLNAGNIVAKLLVKFPAGSTVTITSGTVTLTAQNGPEDTEYTFMLPFPGDWTITIVTPDGVTTTQTVTVTVGNDQAIAPVVKKYLFDKGHTFDEITGGWERWCNWNDNYTINTNYPAGYLQYGNAGNNSGGVGTVKAFVIPAWAKWLKGIGNDAGELTNGGMQLLDRRGGLDSDAVVLADLRFSASLGTFSVDVSSVAGRTAYCGRYMFQAGHREAPGGAPSNPYHDVYTYELWFEPDTTI